MLSYSHQKHINWIIIKFSHKSTPSDKFDEIHQAVLDGISDNMASLFESSTYGAINKTENQPIIFTVSCSYQGHIHYRKTQKLMDKL